MAAMKIVLFVAVVASAIAYAQSIKCYGCDSRVVGQKCSAPQSEGSNVIDCSRLSALTGVEYSCARFDYEAGSKFGTTRFCAVKGQTCDKLEKESQVPLKNCIVCDEDNCNGN